MSRNRKPIGWLIQSGLKEAQFWKSMESGTVQCGLCPRQCRIGQGKVGFCKARYNDGGILKTAIYGKLLTPSIEPIETEAVFHFWPGTKILSVGNLGCNLRCDFCQNWESSNLDNLSPLHVKTHTPESVVRLARNLGAHVISFTYNDPVIWIEFLEETAKIAKDSGIATLFKSAGFMTSPVARRLCSLIDIFSISLKSINPETFKRMSGGTLDPVLEALQIFYKSGRHLEISNLIVPGLTDVLPEITMLARWVRQTLSDRVPLHFVRFHPCYKYTHVDRTPVDFLENAREVALAEGLKYVYIGNTFIKGHGDIFCAACGARLVERYGLYTRIEGFDDNGRCRKCGAEQDVTLRSVGANLDQVSSEAKKKNFIWHWVDADARNVHLQLRNDSNADMLLVCDHLSWEDTLLEREQMLIPGGGEIRVAVGQIQNDEKCVRIVHPELLGCEIAKLMDRAHFPLEEACL